MQVSKVFNPSQLGVSVCKDAEVLARANRDLAGGSNGLYRNGITVFMSDVVYEKTYTIPNRPSPVKGAVFVTAVYDEEGNFVKNGTVSPSSLLRVLYASDHDATGAQQQVNGILDFGETPKQIVENLIKKRKAIAPIERKQLCRPVYNQTTGQNEFGNMVRREYTIFGVVDIPERVENDLYGTPEQPAQTESAASAPEA